jgi:uncharacterized membrane protein
VAERNNDRRGGTSTSPSDALSEEFQHLLSALSGKVLSGASDKIGNVTERLGQVGDGSSPVGAALGKAGEKTAEGKSPLMAGLSAGAEGIKSKVTDAVKGGGKGGGGKGGKETKVTNIIEEIDIGAPVDLVYNQWTQFQDFSKFMKKVDGVNQDDDPKVTFKAQVLWSHRTWQATIIEQVPDTRIVWRSSGEKGHVDGAVTFHELAPELTRVLVVLEYHPQGLFERTGNLWRAQGRRVRLELKHFRRHVMTQSLIHPDDVEGWRGEIHDSKVEKSDEDVRAEEDESSDEPDGSTDQDENDEYSDEYDDESDEESDDEDSEDEGEYSDEYDDESDEESDEEADDEDSDDEGEYSDEYDDESDEEADDQEGQDEPRARRSRRPARAGGGRR